MKKQGSRSTNQGIVYTLLLREDIVTMVYLSVKDIDNNLADVPQNH
jgi:hypothetical protein